MKPVAVRYVRSTSIWHRPHPHPAGTISIDTGPIWQVRSASTQAPSGRYDQHWHDPHRSSSAIHRRFNSYQNSFVLVDDWVRRERFVFVGWSDLLLLPTAYLAVGGWFTVSTPSNASGYRKTNWITNPMVLGIARPTGCMVVGTRKSKWIRIPWLWVLASSTPMLLTRRIRWVWVLAESDGYGYSHVQLDYESDGYGYSHVQLDLWLWALARQLDQNPVVLDTRRWF